MTGPVWHAAHSNPNLQWNTPPNQLARSCSHPPDVFCWDQVINNNFCLPHLGVHIFKTKIKISCYSVHLF